MAKNINPQQIAQQWQTRVSQSGSQYKQGIQNTTVNPCALAAAQADVWANNTVAAKQKFHDNLASNSQASWQASAVNAVNSYTAGATKGAPKMQAFMTQFIPVLQGLQSQLASMP